MRSTRAVALVAATLLLVTACAGNPDPPPATPTGEANPAGRTASAAPTGRSDPDRRGDLVRGYRSLTGTIDRSGAWVLLRVDGVTWALLGAPAADLPDGRVVTVAGVTAPLPPDCPADQAVTLR
ncbi:hypothetical protein K7640_04065 [Micromonospora sp. PLK6-60]|uniref:hypothetical protein n=1 Tax=Micromonospora sp. PLK6-60 TaxID=2873383 RepID=UPI001CA7469D|nr:hypothetical protein [Micromonospora sp. PLK6-60]MBY8871018.1 hypothetical protein [Micromonospora sp. PLK6-60]